MNKSTTQNDQAKTSQVSHNSQSGKRPDVRDNLDSRANEEQDDKGDDTTHNKKETSKEK